MSVLFGTHAREQRALSFISPPIPRNSEVGPGNVGFDTHTTEASLQKVAVWACVNLIATFAECMPLDAYTGQEQDKRQVPLPAWLADLGGDGHGLPDWLYQLVFSLMLRGNGVGIVGARDQRLGTPTLITLAHPDDVSVRREQNGALDWRIAGRHVDAAEVWHARVHPVPGRVQGLSPIEMHALTIGTGISALRFGAQWFTDGAHPSGILANENDLNKAQSDTAKRRFMDAVRGNREPVVLGNGWSFKPIQVNPNESQFLETNNYTAAECCRIFGPGFAEVFGYETGGSLTYANVEQRSLDLLTYAADPWLVRLERLLSKLLPRPRYVKFNRAALVRTDLLTRYRAHEIALRNRFETPNEVREVEDMPPVSWGDEPLTNPTPAPAPVRVEE
ncbi:phage portal protein [Actinoallomurus sp. CA-142502]|uniref:phage portal protein n=1 Tax=Actinoallomurus sp. CA-142502 TaxID=3239885 RepID=UPI003D89B58F